MCSDVSTTWDAVYIYENVPGGCDDVLHRCFDKTILTLWAPSRSYTPQCGVYERLGTHLCSWSCQASYIEVFRYISVWEAEADEEHPDEYRGVITCIIYEGYSVHPQIQSWLVETQVC